MRTDEVPPARWEADTVPLTRRLRDTLELPVVSEPDAAPAGGRPVIGAEPQHSPRQRSPRQRRRRRVAARHWLAGVLAVALLGAATGAGLSLMDRSAPTRSPGTALPVQSVSSVDPSGGSGWRRTGSSPGSAVWRTQHYRSAEFGGLKSGVGLLVDLGTRRTVTAVRTSVAIPGTDVELRAGNSASSAPEAFALVDRAGSASGSTTLQAQDGGAHRYWLVWVPRLGRDDGGYSAVLRGLTFRA